MPHSLKVITDTADLVEYVSLKHSIKIMGYDTQVFLPIKGDYDPESREGSIYNQDDHEYRYSESPSFIARLAYGNPQESTITRGTEMIVNKTNIAYTLKNNAAFCPGDIVQYSKLLVNYGGEDLSYFVHAVTVLRNPNAGSESDEALIKLELVMHV